ncbi:MAG: hypothetical protein WC740_16890 [Verrucomicrobiia bacterium]
MSADNRFLKAVTKLNELTQDKQLKWEKEDDTNSITYGTENIVDVAYYAVCGDRRLRLYELKYRDYPDAPWETMTVLEFVDSHNKSEWVFPENPATRHLLESVRYNTSKVDDFINELLDDVPR